MTTRLTDAEQWEILIEEMGYMAQLRNLRNLDKAKINSALRNKVAQRLSNPVEVARSKQLPFRFYTAWMNVSDQRWLPPLEKALELSVPNIPALDGQSLILIDTSGSMQAEISDPHNRGTYRRARVMNANTGEAEDDTSKSPRRVDAAALFAIALALRNPGKVDVYGFADGQMAVNNIVNSGRSILQTTDLFAQQIGKVGHGTQIERAVRDTYKGQDRVFIFTDMQTVGNEHIHAYGGSDGDIARSVPKNKHVYGFDLSGYENTAMDVGDYRHEMGGLTDHTFGSVPQIESGAAGKWPWE
jgi:hypothetical protein